MHDAAYKLQFSHRRMALRVMTYTGLAWEGLLRARKGSGGDARPTAPLPPVIPFVVYNGASPRTAPLDVSELVAPATPALARLQPANRYVLLDMQRAEISRVPKDNAVGLQVALEQATFEESVAILRRVGEALAGPEHAGLRAAFAQWVRRSWDDDYGVLTDGDEALRGELARMAAVGDAIFDCGTGSELLAAARRIVGAAN